MQASAINGGNRAAENITRKFTSMNRSPRMRTVQNQWLQLFKRAVVDHPTNQRSSGGLWAHFSSAGQYDRYGSWGLFEYTGQPYSQAVKYGSLQSYVSQTARRTPDRSCSFVETSDGAFGCFSRAMGQPTMCFRSSDRGRSWQVGCIGYKAIMCAIKVCTTDFTFNIKPTHQAYVTNCATILLLLIFL